MFIPTEIEAREMVAEKGRDILRDLLSKCNERQNELFCRMYKSVDVIELSKIPWAIVQCSKTVSNNSHI